MEGSILKMWIITLVVLFGLSWNTCGQKTFRRACDCEYTIDGKCAYTLLLPNGQGEGMCPEIDNMDSNYGEMSGDIRQKVNDLQMNFTQLLRMYSNQATMLNQVYSTFLQRLLFCPALQECVTGDMPDIELPTVTIPDIEVPTVTMPEVPTVTMPDIEVPTVTMPDIEVPTVTMPDIEVPTVTMPDIEVPTVTMPGLQCSDVCPELDSQMEVLRIMVAELGNLPNVTFLVDQITSLNATLNQLYLQVIMMGGDDTGKEQPNLGDQPMDPLGPNTGSPYGSIPMPNLGASIASLGVMVNTIINSGAICFRKGVLVSGDTSFLPDASISASSVFNHQHVADRVRIFSIEEGDLKGAWCPGEPNTPGQEWIQFDLGRVRTVYGVVTKGRADYEQWVTAYTVSYTNELNEEIPDLTEWIPVTDLLATETQIFDGNNNQNSPKYNYFDNPLQARYIRIIPLEGHQGQNMCMRADVIGCVEEPTLPTITI